MATSTQTLADLRERIKEVLDEINQHATWMNEEGRKLRNGEGGDPQVIRMWDRQREALRAEYRTLKAEHNALIDQMNGEG